MKVKMSEMVDCGIPKLKNEKKKSILNHLLRKMIHARKMGSAYVLQRHLD